MLEGGNLELVRLLDKESLSTFSDNKQPSTCPHLALTTKDMEETLQMIKDRHVPIVKGPLEIENVAKWIYVSDPDKNVIEFIQWL